MHTVGERTTNSTTRQEQRENNQNTWEGNGKKTTERVVTTHSPLRGHILPDQSQPPLGPTPTQSHPSQKLPYLSTFWLTSRVETAANRGKGRSPGGNTQAHTHTGTQTQVDRPQAGTYTPVLFQGRIAKSHPNIHHNLQGKETTKCCDALIQISFT